MPLPYALKRSHRGPLYCEAKTARGLPCKRLVMYCRAARTLPGLIDGELADALRPPEFVCEYHVPRNSVGYYRIGSEDRKRIQRG